MANVDMCEHDWPGSGCRQCFPPMEEPRVTRCGKQIKLDGDHLADAVSDEAAQVIVDALTWIGTEPLGEAHDRLMKFFD